MTNYSVKWSTIREIYSSAATLIELYYCSQAEYLTIIVIWFFRGDLSVSSVSLIGIRYTETVSELQQLLTSWTYNDRENWSSKWHFNVIVIPAGKWRTMFSLVLLCLCVVNGMRSNECPSLPSQCPYGHLGQIFLQYSLSKLTTVHATLPHVSFDRLIWLSVKFKRDVIDCIVSYPTFL